MQLYAIEYSGWEGPPTSHMPPVDEGLSLDARALLSMPNYLVVSSAISGTIPSGSSKSVRVPRFARSFVVVCDGVASIRVLPESKVRCMLLEIQICLGHCD